MTYNKKSNPMSIPKTKLSAILVQYPVAFGNVKQNFDQIRSRLKNAQLTLHKTPHDRTSILMLPELFSTGYHLEAIKNNADFIDTKSLQTNTQLNFLATLAQEYGSYLYTSIPERDNSGSIYNTAVLLSPKGNLVQKYRKIHLFLPLGEEKVFTAGKNVSTVDIPLFGKVGLSICYDLRFSEIYAKQRNLGVGINLICAEWPNTRIDHWVTMLQSRAIENQVFVCAINRVGKDETGVYGGNSLCVDPFGKILMNLGEKDVVSQVNLDTRLLKHAKELFDVQKEKRLA